MGKIKLGIIGLSEGNGHPYSWSAIFNGFNSKIMASCPFAVIPEYLNKRDFPNDFLTEKGIVTHIYTQDPKLSEHIAKASKISNIVKKPEDLIGNVDAVLLARDDAERHFEMSKIFIEAGIPIYIDKPLAFTKDEAKKIFDLEQYPNQIFTCSALRYADELKLSKNEINSIDKIIHVEASIPKKWETYSVHILEPIVSQLPKRGKLLKVHSTTKNQFTHCLVEWKNLTAYVKTTGENKSDIVFKFYGKNKIIEKKFYDTFSCFKSALNIFIDIINNQSKSYIDKEETLEIVDIIEKAKQ